MLKALYPLLRISLIIIIYVICSKHHVKEQNVRISLFHRHFAAPNRTVLASTHNTLIVCNLQLCSLLSQPGSFGVRRAEGRFTALLDIFPVSSSLLFLSPDNDGWERGMSKTQKHGCFFTHMCSKLAIREFHCVNDTYCFWSAVAVAIYFAVQATGFKRQDMALTQWSLQFASLMGRELWAEHVAMLR